MIQTIRHWIAACVAAVVVVFTFGFVKPDWTGENTSDEGKDLAPISSEEK
jgi:hypothetical protein